MINIISVHDGHIGMADQMTVRRRRETKNRKHSISESLPNGVVPLRLSHSVQIPVENGWLALSLSHTLAVNQRTASL